ncbi:hypothetical protein HPP92_011126 [Vanilla planifolia]|uniref:DUF4220 domain-containing protein n=1 Tax=Vanilla planifolia TaxID=51239 RepID=A0A835QYF9_VANPL|nr:hypothetical protein HPP92_011126 [Vanilla planifolia]
MVARVQDENEKDELNALKGAFDMYSVCKPFFVDVIPLVEVYKVIGDMLKEMTVKEVLGLTSMELSYAYDEMYTKGVVNCSRAGVILRVICSSCILLAFLLFVFSPKHGFDTTDVTITYVLLGASICLDTVASLMFLLSDWPVIFLLEFKKLGKWGLLLAQLILRIRRRLWRERRWRPSEMPQLNLITNCFRNAAVQPKEHVSPDNPKNRRINKWARRIESKLRRPIRAFQEATVLFPSWTSGFSSYTSYSQKSVKATQHLLELVTANAQKRLQISWGQFNDKAGLAALRQVDAPVWVVPAFLNLTEGLSADQQVLVWHIATQLCYHWKPQELHPLHHPHERQPQSKGLTAQKSTWRGMQACKCLSDYMLYLVLMRPEIMATMGGASPLIYWHACYDMVQFIEQHEEDLTSTVNSDDEVEGKACRLMLTEPIEWITYPSLFQIARVLAHLILVLGEEQRWQVITSAWVELLMQGAKNTRASMHVKQLGRGSDLLTFVWLLVKHVGMVDALDIGGYMTGGALDTAKQLPSFIKLYLRNRPL